MNEDGTDREKYRLSKKVHDQAKVAAVRDLIDLHRGEFELLRAGYVDYFKQQLGWVNGRPAAARERNQPRGEQGRWSPIVKE